MSADVAAICTPVRRYCSYCDADTIVASGALCRECGNHTARPPAALQQNDEGEGENGR